MGNQKNTSTDSDTWAWPESDSESGSTFETHLRTRKKKKSKFPIKGRFRKADNQILKPWSRSRRKPTRRDGAQTDGKPQIAQARDGRRRRVDWILGYSREIGEILGRRAGEPSLGTPLLLGSSTAIHSRFAPRHGRNVSDSFKLKSQKRETVSLATVSTSASGQIGFV